MKVVAPDEIGLCYKQGVPVDIYTFFSPHTHFQQVYIPTLSLEIREENTVLSMPIITKEQCLEFQT